MCSTQYHLLGSLILPQYIICDKVSDRNIWGFLIDLFGGSAMPHIGQRSIPHPPPYIPPLIRSTEYSGGLTAIKLNW
ncbi:MULTISPECIES: hypothetical protein [Cyanophyceae]|uniref:hypothetical protein n=1 Tax=Cyanophyceae TaxID=3028117 RepID=UPI00168A3C78|nr:hypothetical protein [Trichocoleus sp. FACHB-40]MBD2004726.1 hypothetical protein [Trichocoleus sp. FACHB-40]